MGKKENTNDVTTFKMWKSFSEGILELPNKTDRMILLYALWEKGALGETPSIMNEKWEGTATTPAMMFRALYKIAEPNLENSRESSSNGSKPPKPGSRRRGRPTKAETEARKKEKEQAEALIREAERYMSDSVTEADIKSAQEALDDAKFNDVDLYETELVSLTAGREIPQLVVDAGYDEDIPF